MNKNVKIILLVLSLFLNRNVLGQVSKSIIYDFPKPVTEKIKNYIEGISTQSEELKFVAELNVEPNRHYVLNIILYDFEGIESFKVVDEGIIKKTNRVMRVSEGILLPLIFGEDFEFGFFGSVPTRNGIPGRKSVDFVHESFSIVFDKSGNIFD